ncbi:hypothetical protein Ccrd_022357 [Cynara cardunculus var. scolymus]|uniref:Uncharacterized protein n=1 Tax=Cynara cardunculus var. scolymus TaxID=59895 RepID=A0A118JZ27_CYNCS|nr:hypothetical protein Ccrd_022357 [Cynara cardunculus var. scolymus]
MEKKKRSVVLRVFDWSREGDKADGSHRSTAFEQPGPSLQTSTVQSALPPIDGLKPIQVAAARGNRGAVEILFPLSSPVESVSDWSVDGIIEYMQSEVAKEQILLLLKTDFGLRGQQEQHEATDQQNENLPTVPSYVLLWLMLIPGVSITLSIWPSFSTVVLSSEVLVTPAELAFDRNSFVPRILFPVALLPLPVLPTKTRVLSPFKGAANSQSSSIELPPII